MAHGEVRLKLVLAYVGTRFSGWQIQGGAQEKTSRTVQGCLEKAVAAIVGKPVRVHGAGRTDAGVHALGQVAHFDIPKEKASIDWQLALNGLLPGDVRVLEAGEVDPDFHARFSAQSKIYTYNLWLTRRFVLPQRSRAVWVTGPLDLDAMARGAALFLGERDFAAFQNQGTEVKSTVRKMYDISYSFRHTEPRAQEGLEVEWTLHASGFLKQMARNIMGCLVAVGKGKIPAEDIKVLLEKKDRTMAPATAPPQGLTMCQVLY